MKLSEIKNVKINESVVPITTSMTIAEIVKAGKITNTAQAFVLANALLFLRKSVNPSNWANFDQYRPAGTDGNIVQELKNAKPDVQVALAQEVLDIIHTQNTVPVLGINPDARAFVQSVLRAQD